MYELTGFVKATSKTHPRGVSKPHVALIFEKPTNPLYLRCFIAALSIWERFVYETQDRQSENKYVTAHETKKPWQGQWQGWKQEKWEFSPRENGKNGDLEKQTTSECYGG